MEYAFKKYGSGKVTWAELIEPARQLAANGFAINNELAGGLKSLKDRFGRYEDSKRIFLNNGNYLKEGDLLIQKDLAATLARIQKNGAKGFYEGITAKLIADDMKANNGLITLEDLKNYKVREREPLRTKYRGHEIIAMPPPSSGGIVMFQTLAMLEKYDLRKMEWSSAQKHHLLIEALRRSYADRAEYMGDPDFTNFPVKQLLDPNYNEKRRLTIDPNKATRSADVRPGELSGTEPTETTHFTVVDKDGTIASNTYTLNNGFGSFVTAKGTGVLMNNEMDDFASQPGKPNGFGLVQGERNKIELGKRPLSSMTPTIVLNKDGSPWFAVGAQGGPRIITAVIQTVINVIDYDMNIQAAMDAPRIHHQWLPDVVIYEPFSMSPETRKSLESMGHIFAPRPGYNASATGIAIEPGTNVRLGATDARGEGEAVGY